MARGNSPHRASTDSSTVASDRFPIPYLPPPHRKRWNKRLFAGAIILLIMGGSALLAPSIVPYPRDEQDVYNRLSAPSREHWLGQDKFGRDQFSRIIYGGRISMAIGVLSTSVAVILGIAIGASSGYFGRSLDAILQRFTELALVFPSLFLLILVISAFGRSVTMLILILGLTSWAVSARILRGEVLKVKSRDYILASQSVGATSTRIILRHILPNVASVVIVSATVRVGFLILAEAGLSFLGLGISEPQVSWGVMIAESVPYLRNSWWLVAVPGFAIWLTVMGFNLMGEGLRDLLDPRGGKGRAGGQT